MAQFTGLKELQNRPHKSGHDISAKNCFTAKVGELLPVWTDLAIPNSTYRFNLEYFTRTRPVQTSAYTRIREYFDFFAVPCDLIWKSFDSDYVIYCEYGDDYRYEDDCFYSDYYNASVANDYADRNGTFCDYSEDSDDWREDGDYEESSKGNTATREYAQENWYWSDYSNEWEEDAVYSEYHETYIAENDAVEVYTTVNQSETDWRADDDDTWFEWEYDGEKYDNEISEDDLREENGLDEEEEDEEEEEEVKPKKKRRKLNK